MFAVFVTSDSCLGLSARLSFGALRLKRDLRLENGHDRNQQ